MRSFPYKKYHFEHDPFQLNLKIAELGVCLQSSNSALLQALQFQYQKFVDSHQNPELHIDIYQQSGLTFPNPDGNQHFFITQEFHGNRVFIYSNFFTGYVEREGNQAKVVINEADSLLWLEHFLRIAFAVTALKHQAVLFHGAGIIDNGKGHVFYGPAGAGKSTVTRFSTPRPVLGDDMLVIRQHNGSADILAAPFNSEQNGFRLTNSRAPIKACYRLVQDSQTYLEELRPGQALAGLLTGVRPLNFNQEGSRIALDFCTNLLDRIPCYELHFKKDNSFWRIIHEAA